VLWPNGPNGGVIDLGNLGGTILNIAFYINNQGQVVGQSSLPGSANCTPASPPQDCPFHAFLWQNGVMTDMGVLPGDVQSWANNINSKGQAVGTSFPETGSRAFIWQNGVMTDLNTLIPANSGFYLAEAFGINERGQISGFGLVPGGQCPPEDGFCNQRAYLLAPCANGDKSCGDSSTTAPSAPTRNSSWSLFRQRYHLPGQPLAPRN
jgi:probable HAF family extracellular repeat protein